MKFEEAWDKALIWQTRMDEAQPEWDQPLKAWICESMGLCTHASLTNGEGKE